MAADGPCPAFGPNEDRRCEWDGRPLPRGHKRWCGSGCARAWAEHHVWLVARVAALEAADYRCDRCAETDDLEVHHREPVPIPGGYGLGHQHHQANLEVLCPGHHREAHRVLRARPGDVVQLRLVA